MIATRLDVSLGLATFGVTAKQSVSVPGAREHDLIFRIGLWNKKSLVSLAHEQSAPRQDIRCAAKTP